MTQITIESKDFNRAIGVVSKVINKRSTFPILESVLLSLEDGRFYLTGSNSEAWGKLRLQEDTIALIDGKDFDKICLPTEIIKQILGNCPDQRLVCDIDSEGSMMQVKHQTGHFSVPVTSAAEYPNMPTQEKTECQFDVDSAWLVPRVKASRICVDTNMLRPQMGNIALVADHEGLDLVATDGQLLYKDRLQVGLGTGFMTGEPQTVLLHQSVFDIVATAFQSTEKVTIKATPTNVMLCSEDFTLSYRPVDGRYPNYNSVIPKQQPHHVTVCVDSFVAALKRVAIFASNSSNLVILRWEGGNIILDADDVDYSHSASETVAPAGEDNNMPDGFKIGFKAASAISLIGCITTDNAVLEFSDRSRPITLREEDANSHLVLLQMPMAINE